MFKVSLLPDSYRRHLENKIKIDFVSRVALVVLVCMAIVLGGIVIKGTILNSKYEKIDNKNELLEAQFPALQEYQLIYNDLVSSKNMIEGIVPKETEAVEFLTLVSNKTPDYVQITEINLENWFTAGMCTLVCKVQDYKDVQDYKAIFEAKDMSDIIKLVQVTSIKRTIDADGNKDVTFTIVLSMSNAIEVPTQAPQYVTVTDKKGEAVTDDDGKLKTEVSTEKSTESTKDSGKTTKASDSESTTKKGA